MAEEIKQELDPKVTELLDRMDWKRLEASTGITREQVEARPKVASDLAYGRMTGLVSGFTDDISGMYALRAVPGASPEDPMRIKAYTMEPKKGKEDAMFLYGNPLPQFAKDALTERTSWVNSEGKTVWGLANANAGRPVSIKLPNEEKPVDMLVSIHDATNTLIGRRVEGVRKQLMDDDGHSRGLKAYGVEISDRQAADLAAGKPVILKGTTRKDGVAFESFPGYGTPVQYDAARGEVVAVHPVALKKAIEMNGGIDAGTAQEREASKARKAAPKAAEEQKAAPAPKPERKTRAKLNI